MNTEPGTGPIASIPRSAVDVPTHAAAIHRLNLAYLLAVRDAARESVPYSSAAFGVPFPLARWVATAQVDEVLKLAALPVCAFALRIPERAIEKVVRPSLHAPDDGMLALAGLHTALAGFAET